MPHSEFNDPFKEARNKTGIGKMVDQDDPLLMVLSHADVKAYAQDHQTFSSDARPGRIVVPSEEKIRDIRQIPFEMDPPEHTAYRGVMEDWFRRPYQKGYEAALDELVAQSVDEALQKEAVEVVTDFSLRLQSKALTLLVNVPIKEAETWISWGTHVFRSDDNPLDSTKADVLYQYLDEQIEQAADSSGEDMYSVLSAAELNGRKLTKDEIKGIMILTFAGGRDTIINAITNTISYFADHPEALDLIKAEPKLIHKATEELLRYFSPLTHMGRVVQEDTHVCEHAAEANSKISLCWASANRDESVFDSPNEVVLDRSKNPHVAFGFGAHNCLGAHHTRKLMKSLILQLASQVKQIEVIDADENIEEWGTFKRKVGFEKLRVRFRGL